MGTTTIIVNIKGGLIKTHAEFIKKGRFLQLEFFFIKVKTYYNKGDSYWTIELSTTTKVTTIRAFDPLVKLHFLPKDTICSFSHHMFQPFVITTIVFTIIGMRGEIDNKFELLVVNRSSLKYIQIVSFLKNIVSSLFQLELMLHLFGCR
jgi:hypothetical protein